MDKTFLIFTCITCAIAYIGAFFIIKCRDKPATIEQRKERIEKIRFIKSVRIEQILHFNAQ